MLTLKCNEIFLNCTKIIQNVLKNNKIINKDSSIYKTKVMYADTNKKNVIKKTNKTTTTTVKFTFNKSSDHLSTSIMQIYCLKDNHKN